MGTAAPLEILLNGKQWDSSRDFFEALFEALGSEDWHGLNADAFLETMIYYTESHRVQPPYRVVVSNVRADLRSYVQKFATWLAEARSGRIADNEWGDDVNVEMIIE